MSITYRRPYCTSCRLIWGKSSIGKVFNCNQCGHPLTLKSFNPWLKALAGLGIIIGGLLTIKIPQFPVFWIGGLIFGPMFIYNGVKQWFKIRTLDGDSDESAPTKKLKQGSIIICKDCGTKNRVANHSRNLRPICGNCKAVLSESLFFSVKRIATRLKPVWIGLSIVLFVALLAILANQSPVKKPFPSQIPPYRTEPLRHTSPQFNQSSQDNQIQPTPGPTIQQLKPISPKPKSRNLFKPLKPIDAESIKPIIPKSLPTGSAPFGTGIRQGNSTLMLDNGTETDTLVRVIRIGEVKELIRNFFIKNGQKFTAEQLPPGNYVLRVAFGQDWDSKKKRFNYRRSFCESEIFSITESEWNEEKEDGYVQHTQATKMSITLHKVIFGNFKTHQISEENFWR